jgi:hypothetical protein
MPYTVWSRGRLIGESELAYARAFPDMRMGDFEPSPVGETLLPIILGVSPAVKALCDVIEQTRDDAERRGQTLTRRGLPDSVRQTTEYADAASSQDELDSLALELHDPAGEVVGTDWIWFQDTHRLIAIAREEMASTDPDLVFEEDEVEPWQPQPPRYQIMVGLTGYDERMEREAARFSARSSKKRRGRR